MYRVVFRPMARSDEASMATKLVEYAREEGQFKAMHELQRVQAFRLGMNATIPIAVDVNAEISDGKGKDK